MPEPTLDPITGQPVVQPGAPPLDPNAPPDPNAQPQFVQIDAKEWEGIKQRLDAFESGVNFGRQPPQLATPPQPTRPTFTDQVKEIDGQVETLNGKIDEAVSGGKPVSSLLTERDALTHKRTRLQIKHEDIDPALSAGVQTIDQLSAEVTRGKMKYYDLVKVDVESALQALPVEQRMNPQMREAAYQIAVGKNVDKIMEAQREELLRSGTPPAGGEPPPGGDSRSQGAGGADTIPPPKEVLSAGALSAIKGKGVTVDEYYKGMGYKDGWSEFYKARGKEYFGAEEEE